jgi:hypothetical protein
MISDRYKNYDKDHCWQYDIRLNNKKSDLLECGLIEETTKNLKISDFEFGVAKDKNEQFNVRKFIEKHEWLGKACGFSRFYFTAKYNNILAGVIIMGTPNAFNFLLGENNKNW